MRAWHCVLILIGMLMNVRPAVGTEIRVDTGRLLERVSPELFGNSVMYNGDTMGYDWWVTDQRGYDKAKAQWNYYLPYVSELGPTVLRYPSGLGANNFHWKPGIGPIAERDPDYEYGYPQAFGTDEFLQYCQELEAEAIMVVNVSSWGRRVGSVQDAADWVEYCNAPNDGSNPGGGIDWAAVRAANGHAEPYGVKYWELGNEVLFPGWEDYARRVREYSEAMKAIDPTIQIGVICSGGGIDPIFQTEDWIDYQTFMLENTGDSFDFWIQHAHPPGMSGALVDGFKMVRDGATVSVNFTVEESGRYRVRIPVEGKCTRLCPELRLTIDGQERGQWHVHRGMSVLESSWTDLAAGEHGLRLEARLPASATWITAAHQIELVLADDARSTWIDLKRSRELYHAIFGGWAVVEWAYLRGKPYRGDRPVFYTEISTHYKPAKRLPHLSKAGSLKETLSTGCLYHLMLRNGVPLGNYWLLFQEQDGIGVLEGVAYDAATGERGRPDPRRRPVFHLLKTYRENVLDWVVATDVLGAPSFQTGWQTGIVIGCAQRDFELSYIQALGTVSEESDRMSLFLINLHPSEDREVRIRLQGGTWKPEVRAITITGASPDANNEPEDCPGGNCVAATERVVRVQGNPVPYRLPKHSVSVLVFYGEGVDLDPPKRPVRLRGSVRDGSAVLAWEPNSEQDLAGYFVYRSRVAHGPFRHRLNEVPIQQPGYVDTATDRATEYTYAVKAVDLADNQSDFSAKIRLTPLPGDGDSIGAPPDGMPGNAPPSPPVLLDVRALRPPS